MEVLLRELNNSGDLSSILNILYEGDETLLHTAALDTNPKYVEYLLKIGADATITDKNMCIPLHYAHGSVESMKLLIVAFPGGICRVNYHGETPLRYIMEYAEVDIVRVLLDAGSNVDATCNKGYTPLYMSFFYETRDVSHLLLDYGARIKNVNLDEYVKEIPAWVAGRKACAKISIVVTSLRKPGVDPQLFKVLGKYVWSNRKK